MDSERKDYSVLDLVFVSTAVTVGAWLVIEICRALVGR